ncbi:hypothetical protein G9A89_004953 [Geosiphon pyriformis]|nr:hypothetical protein G9A89_004953 [Geosiphon pyriformis]
MATKFYCCPYIIEHFGQLKQQRKWDNKLCLACGTILPNEKIWNDISGCKGICDEMCQYMILINNWVHKGTPIDDAWKQAFDNNKGIMPECVHNIDAGFDLRYLGKKAIKLEPNLCTYIDFKIALEILTTTMIQLASRSNLVKKKSTLEEK